MSIFKGDAYYSYCYLRSWTILSNYIRAEISPQPARRHAEAEVAQSTEAGMHRQQAPSPYPPWARRLARCTRKQSEASHSTAAFLDQMIGASDVTGTEGFEYASAFKFVGQLNFLLKIR